MSCLPKPPSWAETRIAASETTVSETPATPPPRSGGRSSRGELPPVHVGVGCNSAIQERTVAGLAAARSRGRIGGQPKRIDAAKARQIQRMIEDGTPKSEIAAVLGIGRATLYRHLAAPSS